METSSTSYCRLIGCAAASNTRFRLVSTAALTADHLVIMGSSRHLEINGVRSRRLPVPWAFMTAQFRSNMIKSRTHNRNTYLPGVCFRHQSAFHPEGGTASTQISSGQRSLGSMMGWALETSSSRLRHVMTVCSGKWWLTFLQTRVWFCLGDVVGHLFSRRTVSILQSLCRVFFHLPLVQWHLHLCCRD